MTYCSKCGRRLSGDELFCPGCGVVVSEEKGPTYCSRCGCEIPENSLMCPGCGVLADRKIESQPHGEIRRSSRGVAVTKEKSELVAIILAMIIPGLGHFYVGNFPKGIFFIFATFVSFSIAFTAFIMNLWFFAIVPAVFYLFNIFDAYAECKSYNAVFRK